MVVIKAVYYYVTYCYNHGDKHSFVEGILQIPINETGLATKFASTVYIE